jgi:hypothetical protein
MDPTQVLVGAGITVIGALAAAMISPKSGDLLDAINAWNTSHPDRPFELSGGSHPKLDQVAVARHWPARRTPRASPGICRALLLRDRRHRTKGGIARMVRASFVADAAPFAPMALGSS